MIGTADYASHQRPRVWVSGRCRLRSSLTHFIYAHAAFRRTEAKLADVAKDDEDMAR